MNRTRKTLLAVAGVVAAVSTLTTTEALAGTTKDAASQVPPALDARMNGTWETTVELSDAPPGAPASFSALDTFVPGGGLLVSSSAPGPAGRTLAHGTWTHTGHRQFTSTFVWFRFDGTGACVGTQQVQRTMHLSRSRARFQATDVIEIISPTGAVVATIHGTEVGRLLTDG